MVLMMIQVIVVIVIAVRAVIRNIADCIRQKCDAVVTFGPHPTRKQRASSGNGTSTLELALLKVVARAAKRADARALGASHCAGWGSTRRHRLFRRRSWRDPWRGASLQTRSKYTCPGASPACIANDHSASSLRLAVY